MSPRRPAIQRQREPTQALHHHFLKSQALKNFDLAMGSSIRELRNDIAHNEPTPELMNGARTRMQTSALWLSADTFVSQPLAQAVLKDLGEANPASLLASLLAEVRRRLLVVGAPHAP